MNSLRIELRTRNNVLWHAIHDTHATVADFCNAHALNQSTVGKFLNLKRAPWNGKGKPTSIADSLCRITGIAFPELFPPDLYVDAFREPVVIEADPSRMRSLVAARHLALPPMQEEEVFADERRAEILKVLETKLTPRQEYVIKSLYGFGQDPLTLEEIGATLGVGRERIRQIQQDALSRLRRGAHVPLFNDMFTDAELGGEGL